MPPERASFASRLREVDVREGSVESTSFDVNDEDTFVNALATPPTASCETQARTKPKSSFASRAFECDADADATRRAHRLDARAIRVAPTVVDARAPSAGAVVLWPPEDAGRATATMTVPATHATRMTPRQIEVVRALHERFTTHRVNAGCVVRDAEELEPIVGVCAFASAMLASSRGAGDGVRRPSLLVLCAPNAILAWVQTLQTYGVSGVASARGGSQIEMALGRVSSGDACACVLSHDTYRNHSSQIVAMPWAMCAYDEVHRLKSDKSKAYKAAQELHKKVFRVGLSDQLFTNCDAMELWNVMNWIVPWRLGDRNLYDSYFVKPISDGHQNVHTDVAQQRTRELHVHLSAAMTPGVGEAQLFRQYVPDVQGTDSSVTTAQKALEALATFENLPVAEMAAKLLVMDKRGRDALRCRVVASELGAFATVLERWQKEHDDEVDATKT